MTLGSRWANTMTSMEHPALESTSEALARWTSLLLGEKRVRSWHLPKGQEGHDAGISREPMGVAWAATQGPRSVTQSQTAPSSLEVWLADV